VRAVAGTIANGLREVATSSTKRSLAVRRACPACGVEVFVVSTVRVAAGELVELGARQSGKSAPADWEKKVFFSEMALKKPQYKSGWASAQFREKFGHWPPREWASLPTLSPSLNTRNWLKSRQIAFAKRRAS
jgi:hypothetical protein